VQKYSIQYPQLSDEISENTQASLNQITRQLFNAGISLPCDGNDVSNFLLEKSQAGLKINTLKNYCSLIVKWHQLANYTKHTQDILSKVPSTIVTIEKERNDSGAKEAIKPTRPLLMEEAIRIDALLLSRIGQGGEKQIVMTVQDIALFRLLWWSGCRPHEIVSLKRYQVDFSDQGLKLLIPLKEGTQCKNFRLINPMPFCDPVHALENWISIYWSKQIKNNNENTPLFIRQHRNGNWHKTHMHPNSASSWLRRLGNAANISYANDLTGESPRQGLVAMMDGLTDLRNLGNYFKWINLQ